MKTRKIKFRADFSSYVFARSFLVLQNLTKSTMSLPNCNNFAVSNVFLFVFLKYVIVKAPVPLASESIITFTELSTIQSGVN
jgi:hypothetical protein